MALRELTEERRGTKPDDRAARSPRRRERFWTAFIQKRAPL
jgi:hypothetical protein